MLEDTSKFWEHFQYHCFLSIMFNFRIVPSVLFASVLVSSVGLNANAQQAPSIKYDPFSIEGFRVDYLENSQASYGRYSYFIFDFPPVENKDIVNAMIVNEDGEHYFLSHRSYNNVVYSY